MLMKTSLMKLVSAALLLGGTSFVCAEEEAQEKTFELPMEASEQLAQYEGLLRETALPHEPVAYNAADFLQYLEGIVAGQHAFEAKKDPSQEETLWHAVMWTYLKHSITWAEYTQNYQDDTFRDAHMKAFEAWGAALDAYQDYMFEKYPEQKAKWEERMSKLQQEAIARSDQQGHPADETQPAAEL